MTNRWPQDVADAIRDLRQQVGLLESRLANQQPPMGPRIAQTIDDPTTNLYPKAGNTFDIIFLDGLYTETAGFQSPTWKPRQAEGSPITMVHCLNGYVEEGTILQVFHQNGQWWTTDRNRLIGIQLAVNHPGKGTPFNVWLGAWDAAADEWVYDYCETVKAVDWRHGVPYPLICATGLAQWRLSDTYDSILEIVSLDCTSPGGCQAGDCGTAGPFAQLSEPAYPAVSAAAGDITSVPLP